MLKTASRTSSGQLVAGKARVVGIWLRAGATAGSVVLKDGTSSGETRLTLNTPASAAFAAYVPLDVGIDFFTDVDVTLSQADAVTIIYRPL